MTYHNMYSSCTVKEIFMKQKKYLFSSGEFAKLTGVNKRTLHYYNDIGLFCPEVVGENGYHYYTCFQFAKLELILTLRKIGMSIEEIREYVTETSGKAFDQMMEERKSGLMPPSNSFYTHRLFWKKMQRLKIGAEGAMAP